MRVCMICVCVCVGVWRSNAVALPRRDASPLRTVRLPGFSEGDGRSVTALLKILQDSSEMFKYFLKFLTSEICPKIRSRKSEIFFNKYSRGQKIFDFFCYLTFFFHKTDNEQLILQFYEEFCPLQHSHTHFQLVHT